MMARISEVNAYPSMAWRRHSSLKNCSVGWNSQAKGYICSNSYPCADLYLSLTSPLKVPASFFRLSLTSIRPPMVYTTSVWISSQEGKTVFTLETVKLVSGYLKFPLQEGTWSASGAPNTSISARSAEVMVIQRSLAAGKKPKSKVSNTYFLMSSWLTAQKQLKPFTSLSCSSTLDLKSVEMPTTVRLMPVSSDASSINSFSPAMLLSPTSVSMMILFQQLAHSFCLMKSESSCLERLKPLRTVVPPLQVILSRSAQMVAGKSFLKAGGKMVCPWLLKVVSPTESLGRSLEMNILMASTDSFSLERTK